MTSEQFRWQAGLGAIVGALVADALARESSSWTEGAMRSLDVAEAMLAGAPVPVDLSPADSVAPAIGLASGPPPLLVEVTTVAFIDVVQRGLENDGRRELSDPLIAKAAELARSSPFVDAVSAAGGEPELTRLVGAIAGLEGGVAAVPARLVSTMRSPDDRRGRRYLGGLTNRLLRIERPNWYDPRNRRGPREVLPGLWMSNLFGVSRFTDAHPDGLVLSLCDDDGTCDSHRHHITFHIDDTPRSDANPSLATVIDEILAEVSAARAAGQPVLVHCRHGASRTGLVLRLLLGGELGLSADDALTEAQCLWPHTSTWNKDWTREVERRAEH
ncbi:MAG: hypothetical protein ACR2P0_13875 [Acidimicrobiales bacterium]